MSTIDFTNKVVAITGAARGIGHTILKAFLEAGAKVAYCDIVKGDDASLINHQNVYFCLGDLSKKGFASNFVKDVVNKFGSIDVLVNNARYKTKHNLLTENEDDWDQSLAVSLKSAFFASQQAILTMQKQGGGAIINIGSIAANHICVEAPSYHVAKAGLEHMTRYLAVEAGKYNVRVNAISPGFIVQEEHQARYQSEDNQSYRRLTEFVHPLGRVGTSADIAKWAMILASEQADFVTGQVITVDGGLVIQDPCSLLYRYNSSNKV